MSYEVRLRFDAAEVDGQVLGVAQEVGVGGEDLQVLDRGHGADEEVGRRALEAFLAAQVAELGGLDEMVRRQGDVFERGQGFLELSKLRGPGRG